MTDETHVLSQSGNQFTVRGFHGDYEVHVFYNGHELGNLKQTFTLGKSDKTINISVHTTQSWQGPAQDIHTTPGRNYRVESWVKLLNDKPGKLGQNVELEVSFEFSGALSQERNFAAATKATFYYQGPEPGVDFAVDLASITEIPHASDNDWRRQTDSVIDRIRKNDIHLRVTTASGIDPAQVKIQVLQKRKSFPFGTAVNSWKYVEQSSSAQKYRDFLHTHFNWAVLENALKWRQLEPTQGHYQYDRAVKTIDGLRAAGLKVRGHNMVWSVGKYVPDFVKSQSGNQLRETVRKHIEWTCSITRGKLEHWDVNNENLHGQWFQERLQDRDYDLELFRMAHRECPDAKLFLNDYSVTARGASTRAYLAQAQRFKAANVSMYGIGVQSHFHANQNPNPTLMKERLDLLAQAGAPIWITEMTCSSHDEDKRADCYETAFRVYYSHPAVEGILMWGVWDQDHNMGLAASLLTEAGRRVLDLLENQWMKDETHVLSQAGKQFTVRGFHGNYEIHVHYQGHELSNLTQTFTLGKADKTININIHM
nr:hypothetical protein BaRGS_035072 [Batillaria attramentaria]